MVDGPAGTSPGGSETGRHLAFSTTEYQRRLARTEALVASAGIDATRARRCAGSASSA